MVEMEKQKINEHMIWSTKKEHFLDVVDIDNLSIVLNLLLNCLLLHRFHFNSDFTSSCVCKVNLNTNNHNDTTRNICLFYLWLGHFLFVVVVIFFVTRFFSCAQPLYELVRHLTNLFASCFVNKTLRCLFVPRIECIFLDNVCIVELQQDLRHRLLVEDLRTILFVVTDQCFDGMQQILLSFGVFEA